MMRRYRTWIAYAGVIGVSALGGYLAAEKSGDQVRDATAAAAAERRVELISGCQRSKRDRTDLADAIQALGSAVNAQAGYLQLVLHAASVKQDVKRAAQVNYNAQKNAHRIVRLKARSLRSRTGDNLNCSQVYRKAKP